MSTVSFFPGEDQFHIDRPYIKPFSKRPVVIIFIWYFPHNLPLARLKKGSNVQSETYPVSVQAIMINFKHNFNIGFLASSTGDVEVPVFAGLNIAH